MDSHVDEFDSVAARSRSFVTFPGFDGTIGFFGSKLLLRGCAELESSLEERRFGGGEELIFINQHRE